MTWRSGSRGDRTSPGRGNKPYVKMMSPRQAGSCAHSGSARVF